MARKKSEPAGKGPEQKQPAKPPAAQPPPPKLEGSGAPLPRDHEPKDKEEKQPGPFHPGHAHPDGHHHIDHEVAEVIYSQLLEVRKTVDALVQETREAKIRKRLEQVPVRTSDLMRGFQAAVAKANRSARSGDETGEDIERMSIKDLEISLSAPIIEGGHAEDPVLVMPNINSAGADVASVSMKFTVVSVPVKQRG